MRQGIREVLGRELMQYEADGLFRKFDAGSAERVCKFPSVSDNFSLPCTWSQIRAGLRGP